LRSSARISSPADPLDSGKNGPDLDPPVVFSILSVINYWFFLTSVHNKIYRLYTSKARCIWIAGEMKWGRLKGRPIPPRTS